MTPSEKLDTIKWFIKTQILDDMCGFPQVDGTYAIHRYQVEIIKNIAKAEYDELPIQWRKLLDGGQG